jgi:hypothetical protein
LYTVYKEEIGVKRKSGTLRRELYDFIDDIIEGISRRKNAVHH